MLRARTCAHTRARAHLRAGNSPNENQEKRTLIPKPSGENQMQNSGFQTPKAAISIRKQQNARAHLWAGNSSVETPRKTHVEPKTELGKPNVKIGFKTPRAAISYRRKNTDAARPRMRANAHAHLCAGNSSIEKPRKTHVGPKTEWGKPNVKIRFQKIKGCQLNP